MKGVNLDGGALPLRDRSARVKSCSKSGNTNTDTNTSTNTEWGFSATNTDTNTSTNTERDLSAHIKNDSKSGSRSNHIILGGAPF